MGPFFFVDYGVYHCTNATLFNSVSCPTIKGNLHALLMWQDRLVLRGGANRIFTYPLGEVKQVDIVKDRHHAVRSILLRINKGSVSLSERSFPRLEVLDSLRASTGSSIPFKEIRVSIFAGNGDIGALGFLAGLCVLYDYGIYFDPNWRDKELPALFKRG